MILVTGGTGLLGSHLLLELVKRGERIRALRRKSSDMNAFHRLIKMNNQDDSFIEWVDGDITDIDSIESPFENITHVYHCAAMISFDPRDAKKMREVNVEGTANVVNACLHSNVQKLCYASSVAALGRNTADGAIDENTHWQTSTDNSNYSISKYGAEREVWRGIAEGLNAVIVNPSIILGAGDNKRGSNKMFQQVWKGLRFFTRGITGFVDVRDVAKIMILLMESDINAERFLINSGSISYENFFKKIAVLLNKKPPAIYANPFLSELAWRWEAFKNFYFNHQPLITKETARTAHKKYFYSNEKIRKALNYQFIPFDETLAHAANCYLRNLKENSKQ